MELDIRARRMGKTRRCVEWLMRQPRDERHVLLVADTTAANEIRAYVTRHRVDIHGWQIMEPWQLPQLRGRFGRRKPHFVIDDLDRTLPAILGGVVDLVTMSPPMAVARGINPSEIPAYAVELVSAASRLAEANPLVVEDDTARCVICHVTAINRPGIEHEIVHDHTCAYRMARLALGLPVMVALIPSPKASR